METYEELLEEAYKKDFSKELQAFVGYINLEENCMKKVEITEVPIFYGSIVQIKEISNDSKKVLLEINSADLTNNVEIKQYWRMDIASLTKQTKGINTTIDGDQINHISKMSPLFNYAMVGTIKEKQYIMNLNTGETTLLPIESGKSVTMASWLKENLK